MGRDSQERDAQAWNLLWALESWGQNLQWAWGTLLAIFRMALHCQNSPSNFQVQLRRPHNPIFLRVLHCPERRHHVLKFSGKAAWLIQGELQSQEGPELLEDILCQEPHKPLSAGPLEYVGSL